MSNDESVVTENMVATNSTSPPVVTDDKIEQFRASVNELKLKTSRTRGDLVRQVLGGLLMLGGFVAGLIIYEQSLSQSSALNLASEQILALTMVGLVVIGAALFVSASISRFLRFWMLRNLYEGQAHIDRLVEGYEQHSRL
ncbi:MAG: hypothetical protein M0Z30_04275 [Actinomycetota bacterium]|nr:hypothetical protein [Actinomycetota bacterium]